MKICAFILSIFLFACNDNTSDKTSEKQEVETPTTTYYFIRHAEKDRTDPANSNPDLNEDGKRRAQKWAEILSDVDFDAIYSTNYNRTQQTAQPTAEKNNLEVMTYDASRLYDESFKNNTQGKKVLVVGHSNTTPMFANAVLGNNTYQEMSDSENGNLYIVTIENGEVSSTMETHN